MATTFIVRGNVDNISEEKLHKYLGPVKKITRLQEYETWIVEFRSHVQGSKTDACFALVDITEYKSFLRERFYGFDFTISEDFVRVKVGIRIAQKLLSDQELLDEVSKKASGKEGLFQFWLEKNGRVGLSYLRGKLPQKDTYFWRVVSAIHFGNAFSFLDRSEHVQVFLDETKDNSSSEYDVIIPGIHHAIFKFLDTTRYFQIGSNSKVNITLNESTRGVHIHLETDATKSGDLEAQELREKLIRKISELKSGEIPLAMDLALVFGMLCIKSTMQQLLKDKGLHCYWKVKKDVVCFVARESHHKIIRQMFLHTFKLIQLKLNGDLLNATHLGDLKNLLRQRIERETKNRFAISALDIDNQFLTIVAMEINIENSLQSLSGIFKDLGIMTDSDTNLDPSRLSKEMPAQKAESELYRRASKRPLRQRSRGLSVQPEEVKDFLKQFNQKTESRFVSRAQQTSDEECPVHITTVLQSKRGCSCNNGKLNAGYRGCSTERNVFLRQAEDSHFDIIDGKAKPSPASVTKSSDMISQPEETHQKTLLVPFVQNSAQVADSSGASDGLLLSQLQRVDMQPFLQAVNTVVNYFAVLSRSGPCLQERQPIANPSTVYVCNVTRPPSHEERSLPAPTPVSTHASTPRSLDFELDVPPCPLQPRLTPQPLVVPIDVADDLSIHGVM